MKAAVFYRSNEDLVIEDIDVDAPGPREVLVRTVASGVCHSDLLFVDGISRWPAPAVLGHEGAGIVEAVGSEVTYVRPGDRVVATGVAFCGQCEECITGNPHRCLDRPRRPRGEPSRLSKNGERVTQLTNVGSFAEQMLVPESGVVKVPAEVPLEVACLVGCGVITGLGAVFHAAEVRPGSTVAVFGAGGVGLSAIQGARIAGARAVIAVDITPEKLAKARELGATDAVNAAEVADPVAAVHELTGRGVDYAFEAIGSPATAVQALASVKPGGIATIIGAVPGESKLEFPYSLLREDRRLQSVLMGKTRSRVDMPRYFDLYLRGDLMLDEMVSSRRRLDEVNDAFRDQRAHRGTRTVLHFD